MGDVFGGKLMSVETDWTANRRMRNGNETHVSEARYGAPYPGRIEMRAPGAFTSGLNEGGAISCATHLDLRVSGAVRGESVMFAPKVDKPRTKTNENPARRPGLERSPLPRKHFSFTPIEQTPFLRTAIRSQELPRPSAGQAPGSHREISMDNKATSAERRGLSWDFTRIPLYPPERTSQAQPSFSPPATRFAGTIQTKLEVGSVDDPLEREADRVAEQVMRMPDAVAGASASRECGAISRMQRKSSCGGEFSDCQKKSLKSEILQRASATIGPMGPMVVPPLVHKVLESPGQPLDAATRAFMEPRFGFDFSRIRVHADCTASESVRSVDSLAYTVGPSIVFANGHYAPHTDRGRRLLAHELTHTIQTGISRSNTTQGKIMRQPGSTQLDGGHRRLIVIDANVIGEINRGNQAIADRLLELRSSATVLISQQAYQELTSQPGKAVGGVGPDLPRTAAANRQLLADMAIHVAPAGDPVRFREVIEANARARNTISNNDIQTAATARANDAELWSPDKSFRTQNKANLERVLRIRIANETYDSSLVGVGHREDYRVARRLLGLHEIDISVGGRTPLGPTGPPARSVSGTISTPPKNTPASTGGGGGSAPSENHRTGGAAGQTSERVVEPAKAVEPSTTSSTTGDPLEPVNEAAHANQEAVGATEGAHKMLHEKMFSNMQQAEMDKAQRALDALTPKIEALRAEGKDVAVTMIVEKQVPNLTHEVISEPGDLVRFIAVRIDATGIGWVATLI